MDLSPVSMYVARMQLRLLLFCFNSLHPSQQFFSHVMTDLPGLKLIKCLAKGHNAAPPVRLEPTTP